MLSNVNRKTHLKIQQIASSCWHLQPASCQLHTTRCILFAMQRHNKQSADLGMLETKAVPHVTK